MPQLRGNEPILGLNKNQHHITKYLNLIQCIVEINALVQSNVSGALFDILKNVYGEPFIGVYEFFFNKNLYFITKCLNMILCFLHIDTSVCLYKDHTSVSSMGAHRYIFVIFKIKNYIV
jgi:hypothetical protein